MNLELLSAMVNRGPPQSTCAGTTSPSHYHLDSSRCANPGHLSTPSPVPNKNTPKGLHTSAQGKDAFPFPKSNCVRHPGYTHPKKHSSPRSFAGRGVLLWVHQITTLKAVAQ